MKHPYITTFASILVSFSVSGPALAIDLDDLDVTIQVIDRDQVGVSDIINRIELPRPRPEAEREGRHDGEAADHERGGKGEPAALERGGRHERLREDRPGRDEDREERGSEPLRRPDVNRTTRVDTVRETSKDIRDEAGQTQHEVRDSASIQREQAAQLIEDRRSAAEQQIQDRSEARESISEQRETQHDETHD